MDRNGNRKQQGVAIIEFALVLVFLLLLAVGITELGRAFWYYDALQKATRDAARCVSVSDWNSNPRMNFCKQLAVDTAIAAGVPGVTTANVAFSFVTDSAGDPLSVTVGIQNFSMPWIWSMNVDGNPSIPAAGDSSPLGVQASMPYTGALCSAQGC